MPAHKSATKTRVRNGVRRKGGAIEKDLTGKFTLQQALCGSAPTGGGRRDKNDSPSDRPQRAESRRQVEYPGNLPGATAASDWNPRHRWHCPKDAFHGKSARAPTG